jgi:hypothetical protein
MIENSSFVYFDNAQAGLLFDDSKHAKYPLRYYNVINGKGVKTNKNCSYYGFVYEGNAYVSSNGLTHDICTKMYFSVSGEAIIDGKGKIILIEVLHTEGVYPETGYRAMNMFGGPLEEQGRLKYIDGCTDSLLIPPVKLGDPCFNHLHFPALIDQTQHTHPSARIGMVVKGNGECITPFGNLPLFEGMIFIIKEWDGISFDKGLDGKTYPTGTHSFRTFDKEGMDVIAFHPDSDFGPTDEVHPMINRTIVNGVSASKIDSIRTK